MNLTNYTLIDVSTGTVLTPHTCVLMPSDALSDSEWEDFDSASDSEIVAIGREHGTPLSVQTHALDLIAWILDGSEWNAYTLGEIAGIVRATGREVRDME